jgi:hypothetical protein
MSFAGNAYTFKFKEKKRIVVLYAKFKLTLRKM